MSSASEIMKRLAAKKREAKQQVAAERKEIVALRRKQTQLTNDIYIYWQISKNRKLRGIQR